MYNWPKATKINNPKAYGNRWTQFNILQTFYLPQCSNKRAVQYIVVRGGLQAFNLRSKFQFCSPAHYLKNSEGRSLLKYKIKQIRLLSPCP